MNLCILTCTGHVTKDNFAANVCIMHCRKKNTLLFLHSCTILWYANKMNGKVSTFLFIWFTWGATTKLCLCVIYRKSLRVYITYSEELVSLFAWDINSLVKQHVVMNIWLIAWCEDFLDSRMQFLVKKNAIFLAPLNLSKEGICLWIKIRLHGTPQESQTMARSARWAAQHCNLHNESN